MPTVKWDVLGTDEPCYWVDGFQGVDACDDEVSGVKKSDVNAFKKEASKEFDAIKWDFAGSREASIEEGESTAKVWKWIGSSSGAATGKRKREDEADAGPAKKKAKGAKPAAASGGLEGYYAVDADGGTIEDVCANVGATYSRGCGFYQVGTKQEKVSDGKLLIAHNENTNSWTTDTQEARKWAGLKATGAFTIKSTALPAGIRLFVNSTSANRGLMAGSTVILQGHYPQLAEHALGASGGGAAAEAEEEDAAPPLPIASAAKGKNACPSCGTNVSPADRFCGGCGGPTRKPCPSCRASISIGESICGGCGASTESKRCSCGGTLAAGARFCPECGCAADKKRCSCGAEVGAKDRFCGGCGASTETKAQAVKAAAPAPAPAQCCGRALHPGSTFCCQCGKTASSAGAAAGATGDARMEYWEAQDGEGLIALQLPTEKVWIAGCFGGHPFVVNNVVNFGNSDGSTFGTIVPKAASYQPDKLFQALGKKTDEYLWSQVH